MPQAFAHRDWVALLRARADVQPSQWAYRFLPDGDGDGETLTYAELDLRARAIAAALLDKCSPGDRALLICRPGLDFIAGFFGCLYAGVIAVPSQPPRGGRQDRVSHRISGIIADCRPRVALTTSPVAAAARDCFAATDRSIEVLCVDQVPHARSADWKVPVASASTIACLQYTSGSTARPRGVVLSHANLLDNSEAIRQGAAQSADCAGVIWLPPYHDMGLVGGILQPLFVGFPVTLMAPEAFLAKPLRWLAAITRFRATTSAGPDFAYALCAREIPEEQRHGLDLSTWRIAFTGAEPVRAQTLESFTRAFEPCGFRQTTFYPCYGLAEATLLVTGPDAGSLPALTTHAGKSLVSCGRPRGGVECLIVDPHSRRRLTESQVGEIWLRGGSVAERYWSGPEGVFDATLAGDNFTKYLRTGDLGFLRDGHLYVTGRLKELIIIRGVNHYPHDIEQTIESAHPALRPAGAAAFSYEDAGEERLAVVCEIERTHRHADPRPILEAVAAAIADAHGVEVSAAVLVAPGQLPKTPSGKTQRTRCRELFLTGQLEVLARRDAPRQPPARPVPNQPCDDLLAWLIARLAQEVGMEPLDIDPSQPWARYGLGSAAAVTLAGEISEVTGRDLPATLFWDYPTPDELAEYLQGQCVPTHAG